MERTSKIGGQPFDVQACLMLVSEMRVVMQLFSFLCSLAASIDTRVRRIILLLGSAGLAFFAASTAASLRQGEFVDAVAGFTFLLICSASCALAWSSRSR